MPRAICRMMRARALCPKAGVCVRINFSVSVPEVSFIFLWTSRYVFAFAHACEWMCVCVCVSVCVLLFVRRFNWETCYLMSMSAHVSGLHVRLLFAPTQQPSRCGSFLVCSRWRRILVGKGMHKGRVSVSIKNDFGLIDSRAPLCC